MKEFILLKEGTYATNAFDDTMETFNNYECRSHDREKLHYLTRTASSFFVHATTDPDFPLALSHFSVNPADPPSDPNIYSPINISELKCAADEYGTAVVVVLSPEDGTVMDNSILNDRITVARDSNGHLVNTLTGDRIIPEGNNHDTLKVNSVPFFGITKLKSLPVYYLITASSIVKVGDGFDCYHEETNIVYRQSTETDGPIKDTIFIPTVDDGNELIGSNIFTSKDTVTISLFDHPHGLFTSNDMVDQLGDVEMNIASNMPFFVHRNSIVVDVTSKIGYIRIEPRLGHLIETGNVENIKFEFSIFAI